jgi:hypothetical protein
MLTCSSLSLDPADKERCVETVDESICETIACKSEDAIRDIISNQQWRAENCGGCARVKINA